MDVIWSKRAEEIKQGVPPPSTGVPCQRCSVAIGTKECQGGCGDMYCIGCVTERGQLNHAGLCFECR